MADTPLLTRLGTWVTIFGSVLTMVLTFWNTQTKQQIDQREARLKEQNQLLEADLRQRSTSIEESKERVDRYKWVYSLVPDLSAEDGAKRNAALAIMRLALSKAEADSLLAGLQQSPVKEVRDAAEQGAKAIVAIESAELTALVKQMNATSADDRKRATGRLQRDFGDSAAAISLVLRQLGPEQVAQLSPSGLINALYYLGRTNPDAWTPEEIQQANSTFLQIRQRSAGKAQTLSALTVAENVVKPAAK